MVIMIFMLNIKSQRRTLKWPNNLRARLYSILKVKRYVYNYTQKCSILLSIIINMPFYLYF